MFSIEIVYESGRTQAAAETSGDLAAVAARALELADHIGRSDAAPNADRAVYVNIWRNDRLEVGIAVIAGGLASGKA